MNSNIQKTLQMIVPFLVVGILIALFVALIIVFFYIFLWGLLIGAVLWVGALIKNYFFPTKKLTPQEGRVIEHDNQK